MNLSTHHLKEVDFFNYHAVGILEVALGKEPLRSAFQTKVDVVEDYLKRICTLYSKNNF